MVGDGNCFYRGISYQLFKTQEEHSTIRSVVSGMENYYKEIFHLTSYQDGVNPQLRNKSAMLVLLVLELHMLKSLQLPQFLKYQFTTACKIHKGDTSGVW